MAVGGSKAVLEAANFRTAIYISILLANFIAEVINNNYSLAIVCRILHLALHGFICPICSFCHTQITQRGVTGTAR